MQTSHACETVERTKRGAWATVHDEDDSNRRIKHRQGFWTEL